MQQILTTVGAEPGDLLLLPLTVPMWQLGFWVTCV